MTRIRRAGTHRLVALIAAVGITLPALMLVSCKGQHGARLIPTEAEARAENRMNAAREAGMPELYAFLKPFPKGGDLHLHLSGAVYAETLIRDGVADHLCFDTASLSLVPGKGSARPCAAGQAPVSAAPADPALYNRIVDALSMRSFVPTSAFSAHDQFFATFLRFSSGSAHKGEWLDEVASRAAAENEQYLEVMDSPTLGAAFALAPSLRGDLSNPVNFAAVRAEIPQATIDAAVTQASRSLDQIEAQRNAIEHCGTAQAQPGCTVQVRWIDGVLRDFTPAQLFAQTLLGFALAANDSRVVAINYLRAEDWPASLAEYHLGMQIIDYCHSLYPKVHITLHAGELAPGLVPPVDLTFHIREAIELGHAERIGHGLDVLYEDHPDELLKEMAARHIDVEVNLTSNAVILGIKGSDHPLAAYRAAHVPFSLSTDDEGVSRIDLTHEYARAVVEQNLSYVDLKESARNSLEHSFLPGESLWIWPDNYDHRKAACDGPITANSEPEGACRQFLNTSQKAAEQWELERRFAVFEASLQ